MTNCNLCGNPMLDHHDIIDGYTHSVCDTLYVSRQNSGKCVDCGIEDCETEFPCVHCNRFGSRVQARRTGGYEGPK